MGLRGSEEEIYYIEQTQILYRSMCGQGSKLTLHNTLVKRILGGPGFIALFARFIDF